MGMDQSSRRCDVSSSLRNSLTSHAPSVIFSPGRWRPGDVCLRFFGIGGATVKTPLDERVMSIAPADLMQVPRRVGVAGGVSKYRAIRAALRGAWVNVLVTDLDTARALAADGSSV
jgi:hypothetical protein